MKRFLIVVDMQNDFVSGALGTAEAAAIVPHVVQKIEEFDGDVVVTYDTHEENYLDTAEGRKLPVVHCVKDTDGWQLHAAVQAALDKKGYIAVEKPTFGSTALPALLDALANGEPFEAELCGLCTDICVVSNALLLKAHYPSYPLSVDAACCAGVTKESHEAALVTMRMCQIDVK